MVCEPRVRHNTWWFLCLDTLLDTGSSHCFSSSISQTSGRILKGIGAWGNYLLLFRQISADDFTASVAAAAGTGGEHPTWQSPVGIVHLLIKCSLNSEEKHCKGQRLPSAFKLNVLLFIHSWMQKQVIISKSSRWSWTMFWMSSVQCLVTGQYYKVLVLEAFLSFV